VIETGRVADPSRNTEPDGSDRPPSLLDDEDDRDELRRRYYGLMQELRVLLPGVQILVAFLLTAPFAARFTALDSTGRGLYAVALGAGVVSVISLATPTVIHRVGDRQARSSRLLWSVRLFRFGLGCFGVSLVAAVTVVARLVFSPDVSVAVMIVAAAVLILAWVLIPRLVDRPTHPSAQADVREGRH
jgi:hypothetical protein